MPVSWDENQIGAPANVGAFSFANGDLPAVTVTLWPHRSLPRKGFVWFISITFAMFLLPLFALLGTLALWGLLPFLLGALALTWYLIERSYRDGTLTETLSIWTDHVDLQRIEPNGDTLDWQANPHWVQAQLHATDGPVPYYLTLVGGTREVELGSFLTPQERVELHERLTTTFIHMRQIGPEFPSK